MCVCVCVRECSICTPIRFQTRLCRGKVNIGNPFRERLAGLAKL